MSEPDGPRRIGAFWSPEARGELRAVDRETAMQILRCLDRYLADRAGDVKRLKSPLTGLRAVAATIGFSLIRKKAA